MGNFRYWTDEEVKYLHESFPHVSDEEIAEKLDRSVSAVKSKRHIEGLSLETKRYWTAEETNYLIANHEAFSVRTLAKKLNTTKRRVTAKLVGLGLRAPAHDLINNDIKPFDIYKCTPNRVIYALYIGDNYITDGTVEYLAEFLRISPSTVRWYASPSAERRDYSLKVIRLGKAKEFM